MNGATTSTSAHASDTTTNNTCMRVRACVSMHMNTPNNQGWVTVLSFSVFSETLFCFLPFHHHHHHHHHHCHADTHPYVYTPSSLPGERVGEGKCRQGRRSSTALRRGVSSVGRRVAPPGGWWGQARGSLGRGSVSCAHCLVMRRHEWQLL